MFIISPCKVRSNYYDNFRFEFNGRVFNSIKKCCTYYGISYKNVIQRKSDTGCSTEESIRYYIDLKCNKAFIFRNRKWDNIHNCCVFYGLNEASVKNTAWSEHVSIQEALERNITWKKTHQIIYHGEKFASKTECCNKYGIVPCTMRAYLKKHPEVSFTKAMSFLIRDKEKRNILKGRTQEVVFRDKIYASLKQCCEEYGLSPEVVMLYMRKKKNKNVTLSKTITFLLQLKKRSIIFQGVSFFTLEECCNQYSLDINKVLSYVIKDEITLNKAVKLTLLMDTAIVIDGKRYTSVSECCNEYGINRSSVGSRCTRLHCSVEDSIYYYIKKKQKEKEMEPIEYNGVEYPSMTACCQAYGISPSTVTTYMNKHGCKMNDALKNCITNKQNRENSFFVFDGRQYKSLVECCKKLGINKSSVVSRKYRLNCSYDEAINHFLHQKSGEV